MLKMFSTSMTMSHRNRRIYSGCFQYIQNYSILNAILIHFRMKFIGIALEMKVFGSLKAPSVTDHASD